MNPPLALTEKEVEELFVVLKPGEAQLAAELADLLGRIEKRLYDRLTIEEMEALLIRSTAKRSSP
jgi:hypothetical protein